MWLTKTNRVAQLLHSWLLQLDMDPAVDGLVSEAQQGLEFLMSRLPRLFFALLVVIGFWLLARWVRKLLKRTLRRYSDRDQSTTRLMANIGYSVALLVGLFVALYVLQLDQAVASLLAGAGIIGLALGIAFQDIATNIIAGVVLVYRTPLQEGDMVETNDHLGIIRAIHIRTLRLETFQGQHVTIPNREVLRSPIVNYSSRGLRRIDLPIGVSYNDDLEKVKQVTETVITNLDFVLPYPDPPNVVYTEFSDFSVNLLIRFWIVFDNHQGDFMEARSEAIMAIRAAYRRHGITIPFPIRTLDFNIQGGATLSDELKRSAGGPSTNPPAIKPKR